LNKLDWVKGDLIGVNFPAHADALREGGAEFLTQAFRQAGPLGEDNRVVSITQQKEVSGGSTGTKLLLSVCYEKNCRYLHQDLFVKFSRDFTNPVRDTARTQMELEVKFALLSRDPNFPIEVPVCYFAEYHHESGTGILITQCISYGACGIEAQYPKALDYKMPDQLGHYRALIRSLARIAATHKAGLLSDSVADYFPFTPEKLNVSARAPLSPEQIAEKVVQLKAFLDSHPNLLSPKLSSHAFLDRLTDEAPRFQAQQEKSNAILQSNPELIALCHWNAHVDNAWFWRDEYNQIECGLMDWGNVSQMNLAMAIWGCLSAAESDIWDNHLDQLLELFIAEFERWGGGKIRLEELKLHLTIYVAKMGLMWMLDMPLITLSRIPGLAEIPNRFDPRIEANERARSQIVIMSAFLNLWEKTDMNSVIHFMEQFEGSHL